MMIFLTAILIIVAFVIGVLVGRILKMSFGCSGQDSQSQAPVESKSETSTAASASGESVSTSSSANLVASEPSTIVKDQAKTSPSKSSTSTKAKPAASKAKTASSTAKKSPANKGTAKTAAPAAKKAAPASQAKSKAASVKSAAISNSADDLKLIKGVGKLNETRLNDEGVTSFAQIARWKKADIAEFDEKLNFKGRIERDEWVPQAKALAKATSTKAKPAAVKKAPAKKAAAVKSATATKSPAKKAAPKAPAKKAAPKAVAKKPSTPDDLKLIKGVGKLIQTKLAKEGITTFSQIAAWKKADVVEFDEKLSFKGRIDRDDWIKQAKVLAKGGTTDFSKRAAKGEVPSSS